jgi:hypothetical protein
MGISFAIVLIAGVIANYLFRILAHILDERTAKKESFQKQMDEWANLEKAFHKGPVENRGKVLETMRALASEMSPYSDATYDELDVKSNDLIRMAHQIYTPTRGREEPLKRPIPVEKAIPAENARLRDHSAVEAKGQDPIAGAAEWWGALTVTDAVKKLGGWWTKFVRDE